MPNRLEIIQWREAGDRADTVSVLAYPGNTEADPLKDLQKRCTGTVMIGSMEAVEDGDVIEHNGRKFKVAITEVRAQ